MLSANQHFQLANYVRINQQAQRDAARTIADPAWQMKRAHSFLMLARMTAKRAAGASRAHKPRPHLPHGPKPAHGATLTPQPGPSMLRPDSTRPQTVRPNAPPPAITGTPPRLGAGSLRMQGAIPGASLPGAPSATPPDMDASRPVLPHMPKLPRIG